MDLLPGYIISGVKYKLSDAIRTNKTASKSFELPFEFDLKDPDVLLEETEYDFTIERQLIFSDHNHDAEATNSGQWQEFSIPEQDTDNHLKANNFTPTYEESSSAKLSNDLESVLKDLNKKKRHVKDSHPKPKPRNLVSSSHNNPEKVGQRRQTKDTASHANMQNVLDQFTDLLTEDVVYTQET